jgi:hypothetical protein
LPLAGGADPAELRRDPETGDDLGWLASYLRRLHDGWDQPRDSLPQAKVDAVEGEFEEYNAGRPEREVAADYQRLAAMHAPGEDDEEVTLDALLGRRELDTAHDWLAGRETWPDGAKTDEELRAAAAYLDEQKRLPENANVAATVPDVNISLLAGPQRDLFTAVVGHAIDTLEGRDPGQLCINVDGTAGTGAFDRPRELH